MNTVVTNSMTYNKAPINASSHNKTANDSTSFNLASNGQKQSSDLLKNQVVLCLDSESLQHPEVIGLADENLTAQPWLTICSDAFEARSELANNRAGCLIWVISSDSMEGINLAAALKADSNIQGMSGREIRYITFEQSGSVIGRCEAAGVKVLRGRHEFVKEYTAVKQHFRDLFQASNEYGGRYNNASVRFDNDRSEPEKQNLQDKAKGINEHANKNENDFGTLSSKSSHLEGTDQCVSQKKSHLKTEGIPDRASNEKRISSVGDIANNHEFLHNDLQDAAASSGVSFSREETKQTSTSDRISSISSLVIDEPLLNLSRVAKPPSDKKAALTIAVVSGSGGSGKSTIALCSALSYQEFGYKTLLLDADLQFGDMAYMLGRDSAISITDLVEEPKRISQIVPEEGLPALIASPEYVEQSELVMTHMAEIIEFVKSYFDVVVLNTGSFWTEQHAQIIESVDKTLFVIDQRPSSVRACSRALALCARCGIAIQPFSYALNFCSKHALLTPLDISCAMQGISVREIKDGGKEVGELLGASLPKELFSTKNAFIQSVRELCVSFLPEGERERFEQEISSEKAQRKTNPFSSLRRRRVACL